MTPEMFGAAGDGAADDTAGVQAALLAAAQVVIPFGKTFRVRSIKLRSGQQLIIRGVLVSIQGDEDILSNDVPVRDVAIIGEGGTIQGRPNNLRTHKGRGIFLSGATNVQIRGLRVLDMNGDGISVYNASGVTIQGNSIVAVQENGIKGEASSTDCSDWKIFDNRIEKTSKQNGIFLYADADHAFSGFSVARNDILEAGDEGIEIGLRVQNGDVSGNTIRKAGSVGILARGAKNVSICGNNTDGCPIGIDVATYLKQDTPVSQVHVIGNCCVDGGDRLGNLAGIRVNDAVGASDVLIQGNRSSGNKTGILTVGGKNIVVSNNNCSSNFWHGIHRQDGTQVSITANQCWDNNQKRIFSGFGVFIERRKQWCEGGAVVSNRCFDDQAHKTQTNGLYVSGLRRGRIADNVLRGNRGEGLAMVGDNPETVVESNR